MPAAETAKLVASLELKDNLSKGIRSATKSLDKMDSRLNRIGSHASRGFSNATQNMERGVLVVGGALAYAVKQAVDWESAVAGINKTVEGTPAQLKAITDGIQTMSTRMPVAAEELAAIAENAGALGIARQDILAFTETVAMLGATTNVSTEDAATALGQLQNVLGLTGDEFDNFAASLVELGNKGASTEAQILEIARRAGGAANLFGIAKEETLGWASAAANLGLNEELAGTALQNLFIKLMPEYTKGSEKLQKVTGETGDALKKAFSEDASGAVEDLIVSISKLPKAGRLEAVQSLFGKGSGLTRLVLGLADSYERNLNPALETNAEAWEKNTAATEEYEKRAKTSASQLQILKNNIDKAAVTIGANLLPALVELAKEGTSWIQENEAGIQQFGKDLGEGAREAVRWLKSLDWDAIGNSLKTAAGFGKTLVDVFLNLPAPVQQLLTGLFVANKFTGGAVAGIGAELAKGAIKGVLGINAGVVNINAATVNGPGGLAGKFGGIGVGGVLALGAEALVLGAIVKAVADETANRSRSQAQGVAATQKVFLQQSPALSELKSGLAAIDAGIDAMPKDPIGGLIHQDAINELRNMRTAQVEAIGRVEGLLAQRKGEQGTQQAVNNAALAEQRKGEQTLGGLAAVETAVSSGLSAHRSGERGDLRAIQTTTSTSSRAAASLITGTVNVTTGAVRSGTSIVSGAIHSLGSAIRSLPPPIVNVSITAGAVQKSETTQNRSGPASGSRQHGHPGSQPV